MRYNEFYPGNKVITIVDYDGVPAGTVGTINTRWAGTVYLIKLPDGSFRWLSDRSFAPADLSANTLEEGNIGVVTSDQRQSFAKVGEKFRVAKAAYDVDYYGVLIEDKLHWLGGFQLAPYLPPATP